MNIKFTLHCVNQNNKKTMVTITQALLDLFPNWAANGWNVGDTFSLASYFQQTGSLLLSNEHPPHRPS